MILIKVWYRFTGLMLKWLYRIVSTVIRVWQALPYAPCISADN